MQAPDHIKIKRALLSVSDKSGLLELAQRLERAGVEIISTGGTFRHLHDAGVKVIELKDYTGEEEILQGRVKTLGRPILGGILFHRQRDQEEAQANGLRAIDLVVCNFYPFNKLAADANDDALVELIDIGGPTMTRASAKNFHHVAILTSPAQYGDLRFEAQGSAATTYSQRRTWAQAAFDLTSRYDSMIAGRLLSPDNATHTRPLRYGENPHQRAWLEMPSQDLQQHAGVSVLQGKEMSFNNYLDLAAAIRATSLLRQSADFRDMEVVSIIKHQNPCGLVAGTHALRCLERAWAADNVSAFGSVICLSGSVDAEIATFITERFVEIIAARSFTPEARAILAKKKNLRLVNYDPTSYCQGLERRQLTESATLVQERDLVLSQEWQWVTQQKMVPSPQDKKVMAFAEHVGRCLKSNAIALVAREPSAYGDMYVTIGLGMGNPNRLLSMKTALEQANAGRFFRPGETWLYSDAFFPFSDGVELAHEYGITKILQPGGSMNDDMVIAYCNQQGMMMAMSNMRHFWH